MIDRDDLQASRAYTGIGRPRAHWVVLPARERLMAAASDLFYRLGVRAVSVDHIVDAAQMTKPTLYRYFGSKDELAAACVEAQAEQGFQQLDAVVAAAGPAPRDALRAALAFFAEAARLDGYRGLMSVNAAIEFPDADHPVRKVCASVVERLQTRLADLAAPTFQNQAVAVAASLTLLVLGSSVAAQTQGGDQAANTLLHTIEAVIGDQALA